MHLCLKIRRFASLMTGSALLFVATPAAFGQIPAYYPNQSAIYGTPMSPLATGPIMSGPVLGGPVLAGPMGSGPMPPPYIAAPQFAGPQVVRYAPPVAYGPNDSAQRPGFIRRLFGIPPKNASGRRAPVVTLPQFQQWREYEDQYTLYPGDQIDIVVSSAPELSRTLTVGPDGRIVMPMANPIMAAGHSYTQVQAMLIAELSKQLRDPRIAVTPRAYGPQQIFVGGEVRTQGTYTMPGPMGVLEAILMAGGMQNTARTTQVAVLRRAPNGGMMMRPVNIGKGLNDVNYYNDVVQLRRGDIIFVPKNTLAEIGVFMQNLRGALPFDVNLTYQFGRNTDNISTVIQ